MGSRLRLIAAAAAGVALAGGAALPASASQSPLTKFAVSPTRTLVSYSAAVQSIPFRLENVGPSTVTITAAVVQGRQLPNGGWEFSPPQPGSGAEWFKSIPAPFKLRVGQTVTEIAKLQIPRSAEGSGQRYLGIFFYRLHDKPGPKINVKIQAGIVAEMIIDTGGHATHGAAWTLSAPSVSWGGAVPVTLSVHNTGNVLLLANHLTAKAGGKSVQFPGILALAGATRTVRADWNAPVLCLPCHLSIAGTSATVWRIPALPLLGLALILAACAGLLVLMRVRHRHARSRRHSGSKRAGHAVTE